MYIYIYIHARVCVCVCVCVPEIKWLVKLSTRHKHHIGHPVRIKLITGVMALVNPCLRRGLFIHIQTNCTFKYISVRVCACVCVCMYVCLHEMFTSNKMACQTDIVI